MKLYVQQIQTSGLAGSNFKTNLIKGLENIHSIYILGLLLAMFLVNIVIEFRKDKNKSYDLTIIFISFIALILYFANLVKMGTMYYIIYLYTFSYIFVFGVLLLDKIKFKPLKCLLIVVLIISSFFQNYRIKHSVEFFQKKYSKSGLEKLDIQKDLQKIVGVPDRNMNFFVDYRVPLIYAGQPFRKNIIIQYHFSNPKDCFDNKTVFDYIALSKDCPLFFEDIKLEKSLSAMSEKAKKSFRDNREFIKNFLETNTLSGNQYELVYEKYDVMLFKLKKNYLTKNSAEMLNQ